MTQTTHTITVAEALAFKGSLAQLAVEVRQDEMAQSISLQMASTAIHNIIAATFPGVNYGAFSTRERRHTDTVSLDATLALAGAYACRQVTALNAVRYPGTQQGDEWPAVGRIITLSA